MIRLHGFFKRHPVLRKFSLVLGALVIVLAGVVTAVNYWLAKEDRKYLGFLRVGSSINGFLKDYAGELARAVESQDVEQILGFYAKDYEAPERGQLQLQKSSDLHGISHYSLVRRDRETFTLPHLREEIAAYVSDLESVDRIACKINLAEVIEPDESARLTVKYVLDGKGRDGRILQDRFFFRWWLRAVPNEKGWEIVRDQLFEDEEILNTRVLGNQQGFVQVDNLAIGVDYRHRRDPNLDPGTVPLKFAVIEHVSGGVTVADYNDDDLVDLFFADGVECRLFQHQGIREDGSIHYKDTTIEAGLAGIDRAHCGLLVDVNNDQHKDLFVTRYDAPCKIYVNLGGGIFADKSREMNLDFVGPCVSATALDYDRDGYTDLYVAVNGDSVNEVPRIPFFARNGLSNRLFRNVEGRRFEDATANAGVGGNEWSLAVCSGDLNNDGWVDIGVANDFGRKFIYRNNGDGTFDEIAKEAGTLDFSAGMGIAFGDLNNDGNLDIYTSNIYSNQRWLGEEAAIMQYVRSTIRSQWLFRDSGEFWDLYNLTDGNWRQLGRMAGEGNSLFMNNDDGTFREAKESCTNRAGWGWGVALFDSDNDADLDIYAANGWISGETQEDL